MKTISKLSRQLQRREAAPEENRRLVKNYYRYIARRTPAEHVARTDLFAITFLPGGDSGSFLGKIQLPLGAAVTAVLAYEAQHKDSGSRRMPFVGSKTTVDHSGLAYYGDATKFRYDGALPPLRRTNWALDATHKPSLTELMLRMDRQCQLQLERTDRLPTIPQLPQILLGFPPEKPPEFEVTPALTALVARQLNMPVNRIGKNGTVLADKLLQNIWQENLISPDAPGNHTGSLLISAELCTQARRALRIYENFSDLLGIYIWNPASETQPLTVPNPARQILQKFHIDDRQDFCQPISDAKLTAMERAMRQELGAVGPFFSQNEIFDAITAPDRPAVSWQAVLPQLRAKLTNYWSDCTTDEDLLQAARDPSGLLLARGACRIQVVKRCGANRSRTICFSPDKLGCRAEANFELDVPSSRPTAQRVLQGTAG